MEVLPLAGRDHPKVTLLASPETFSMVSSGESVRIVTPRYVTRTLLEPSQIHKQGGGGVWRLRLFDALPLVENTWYGDF